MSKEKEVLSGNKRKIMIAAVIFVTVAIVTALALGANKGRKTKAEEKNSGSVQERTEETSQEDITTLADDETIALEDATVDEQMGSIDEEVTTDSVLDTQKDDYPYQIRVNRAANCVTVYKKDKNGEYTEPYKAIVCSTGKYVGDTPLGDFHTLISYEWLLMVDGTYGQFAYRFYGSILFHSVPYYSKDKGNLEYAQFNKLGEPASLGCVRVCVRDAIWLIENCPVGTEVIVYDDEDNPGPLGKPEMIKIPADSPYRGWDPTDPDPENPWNNCKPEITVPETVKIAANKYSMDTIVERIGATATDTCGNDITDRIKAGGSVNFKKLGNNTLVLTVKDAIGRADTKIVNVIVERTEPITKAETTTSKNEKKTTQAQQTETSAEEMTTTAPAPPQSSTPAKPTQVTSQTTTQQQTTARKTEAGTTKKTEQTTTKKETQTTAAKTVTLELGSSSAEVVAGTCASLTEVLRNAGCKAVYSDGTEVADAAPATTVASGTYALNQPGTYQLYVRYKDAAGISSPQVSFQIRVIQNQIQLSVKETEPEVSAGEYQKLSDVLSKMGLSAKDSRGAVISQPANIVEASGTVDLNTPGDYAMVLSFTDSYGVKSNGIAVTIYVR